jgi:pimeloyl-ACP methyl ester carboxylesterase
MDTVVSVDGTPIAYDRLGTGPALVLVGGAYQYRSFDQRTVRIAELLAERFTVYHYDRRGRGDSGDTAPYAIAREFEDLHALVDAAGGSAYLFGMSSGAILTLDAVNAGVPTPRVVVYEPPLIVDDTRPPVAPDIVARIDALLAAGRPGDAVELFLTEAVAVPAEQVAQMRESPMWPGFEAAGPSLAYDVRISAPTLTGRPPAADRWAKVAVPVLVADGGASPAWMRHAADAVAAVLPDARRRTLDGQQHGVAPEVLVPLLTDFFTASRTDAPSDGRGGHRPR